jgi:hypothetical protein
LNPAVWCEALSEALGDEVAMKSLYFSLRTRQLISRESATGDTPLSTRRYDQIAAEIKSHALDSAAWLAAVEDAGGEERLVTVYYIKRRMAQLYETRRKPVRRI